jgi:HEAT repeat protein
MKTRVRSSSYAASGFCARALMLSVLAVTVTLLLSAAPGVRSAVAARRAPASAAASASGNPEVVDLLVQLLAAGTSSERAVAALGALAKIGDKAGEKTGDPRTLDVIQLYTGHRRPEVRREAVAALGALSDARAVAPLIEALGDDAPEVRAAAAEALAARKEIRAVPRLVRLVRRGDMGAAAPAGRLATPEAVADLCGMQGAAAEGALAVALGTYVKRADVSDSTRIEPLRTIAKLHGVEATAALADYIASIPPRDTRSSRREAEKLLDERGADR